MSDFHAPTASELARSAEAVAAHLPKPQTADEIKSDIMKYLEKISAGYNDELFKLSARVCIFIDLIKGEHPEEADNFAAHLFDALRESKAEQHYNEAQNA